MSNVFYVYEHWRPDKNACFWVGKGKGRRANMFQRSPRYNNVVAKLHRFGLSVEVRIVQGGLSEKAAHDLEIERIAHWRIFSEHLTNVTRGGEGVSGYKRSLEAIEKTRRAQLGRKLSSEHKAGIGKGNKGKVRSKETRVNISKGRMGLSYGPHSPETRAKISISVIKSHADPAVRAKISKGSKGRIKSPETRAKLSKSLIGRKLSPSHIESMRNADRPLVTEETKIKLKLGQKRRGPTRPPEHRAKIAASVKAAHERRRQIELVTPRIIKHRTNEQKAKIGAGIRAAYAKRRLAKKLQGDNEPCH